MQRKTCLCLLLVVGIPSLSSATEARSSEASFEKNVFRPVAEYPRPQLSRRDWIVLDGQWDYGLSRGQVAGEPGYSGKIVVPFPIESSLSGVKKPLTEQQRLWYHRAFSIPKDWAGKHVLLHFGAVDWEASVWINKTGIGVHKGGYDPFAFDITDALKPDSEQEIVVSVFDPTDGGFQPRGAQTLGRRRTGHSACSGIWQTVWLEPVNAVSVESLSIVPDVDGKEVDITPQVRGSAAGSTVEIIVLDGTKEVGRGTGSATTPCKIPLSDPKLWFPSAPFLYDVKVTLTAGGKPMDEVTSYFGMRKISVGMNTNGNPVLMLNNKQFFELGIRDAGYWPDGLYTAPNDDALKASVETIKQLGFNMCQKYEKVEPDRWYYWCDKLGLLVWQDIPGGDATPKYPQREIDRKPQSETVFEFELQRIMESKQNHPSIVAWVPFSSGQGQFDTGRILAIAKSLDPTRLIVSTGGPDGGQGDIEMSNGFAGQPDSRGRVLACGGIQFPVSGHLWTTNHFQGVGALQTAQSFRQLYPQLMYKVHFLAKVNGLAGAVYSQLTDVEGEIDGLYTYDRTPKLKVSDLSSFAKSVIGGEAAPKPR